MSQDRPQRSLFKEPQKDKELHSPATEKTQVSQTGSGLATKNSLAGEEATGARKEANMCNESEQLAKASSSNRLSRAPKGSSLETKLEANLHSAASEGKVELVRLLLRCGADINGQDEQFGNTPLHQAAWNGFSQTVQVLCKHRANTSIKNKALFTPLHMACQQGHNQTARLLLMANARTEAKNSYGDTPLHTAARYGHAGVARILLSAKCNSNQVNKNHDTPLHIAAAMGRRKLTKIFMQQGAEPAIQNKQGETAMDIALRKDLIDIQELIANPPPIQATRNSISLEGKAGRARGPQQRQRGSQEQATSSSHLVRSSYGLELYQSGADLRHLERNCRLRRRHQRHLSSDEDHEDGAGSSELAERTERLHLRVGRADRKRQQSSGLHQPTRRQEPESRPRMNASTSRLKEAAKEIAVDVPAALIESAKLVTRNSISQSVQSLTTTNKLDKSQEQSGQLLAGLQRPRRLTIVSGATSGADLHLLSGRRPPTNLGQACLPDAKLDDAGSLISSTGNGSTGKGRAGKASSVAESVRSLPVKARVRVLTRRKLPSPPKSNRKSSARLVGACVGKLSLLRLRGIVNRRAQRKRNEEDPEEEEGQSTASGEQAAASEATQQLPAQPGETTKGGRRSERIQTAASLNLAPNGSHLLVTRPLAPLADDTQLYAIPKKSKAASNVSKRIQEQQQRQQVALNQESLPEMEEAGGQKNGQVGEPSEEAEQPETIARAGPALIGSDAKSSSSAVSSSFSEEMEMARDTPPSSSSPIASSSDECVQSLSLVRPAGQPPLERDQCQPGERPALVGLHGDFSNESPGYSVIKEPSISSSGNGIENGHIGDTMQSECGSSSSNEEQPPCLCGHEEAPARTYGEQEVSGSETSAERSPAQKQRQVADTSGLSETPSSESLLRVSGERAPDCYYAYSPVVQSSSELFGRDQLQQQQARKPEEPAASKTGRAKSWLKSKFSLSSTSAGVPNEQREQKLDQKEATAAKSDRKPARDSPPTSKAPERKAELISISAGEQATQTLAVIVNEQLEREDNVRRLGELAIRPKSALSAASQELIAAQKSLAAAAVAKVKRERALKSSTGLPAELLNQKEVPSVLTVKTPAAIPFWPTSERQQLVVANGRLVHSNYHQDFLLAGPHRKGTNSLGMSDSSPSNNGAESDNSIQTNSGSGSGSSEPAEQASSGPEADPAQPSAGLGILTRLLLNNKSSLLARSSHPANTNSSSTTSGSTLKPQVSSGGSSSSVESSLSSPPLSSSSLSSPVISNENAKLGQLSSRSRRPIVLASGSEADEGATGKSGAVEVLPKLPPKSVLKSNCPNERSLLASTSAEGSQRQALEAAMNGLPRVSSQSQLDAYSNQAALDSHFGGKLCNFHASNQAGRQHHLFEHHPYSVANSNGFARGAGVCAGGGIAGDPLGAFPGRLKQRHTYHLSSHDLSTLTNRSGASSQLDLAQPPTSAYNAHEYYLEAPHPSKRLNSQPTTTTSQLDMDHLHHHQNADSIYIAYVNGARHIIRDSIDQQRRQAVTPSSRMLASGHEQRRMFAGSQVAGPVGLRPRPKSSLGSIFVPDMRLDEQQQDSRQEMTENKQHDFLHQQHYYKEPLVCSEENFIYATDRLAAAFHSRQSELRVMPSTGSHEQDFRRTGNHSLTQQGYQKQPMNHRSLVQVRRCATLTSGKDIPINLAPIETTCAPKTRVLMNSSLDRKIEEEKLNEEPVTLL